MQYKNGGQCLVQQKYSSNNFYKLNDIFLDFIFRTIFEAEDTIRGQHGVTDTRNCGHGSGIEMIYSILINYFLYKLDSSETAQREINFFFPEFDMKSISKYENLSADKLIFNKDTLEHQL
jgi:nucleoside-diphosphate kinase